VAEEHSGKCLCGAVTYRARGLADIWYCHCRQCRYLTGHFLPACRARREDIDVTGEVRWTPVSEHTAHGFCAQCCAPLFWSNQASEYLSILPGSLDHAQGLVVRGHIFVAEKGDYYAITDGLPQFDRWPDRGTPSQ
jgi:hypothetical protein